MLTWTNTNGTTGGNVTPGVGPLTVNANVGGRILWAASAMDLNDQGGSIGKVAEEATRTARICFMRGLSEHVRVQTSSPLPWFHRRICFTVKGGDFIAASSLDVPNQSVLPFQDTSQGIVRYAFNTSVNNMSNTINNQDSILFKGAKGLDWNDYIVAPVDTSRISLKYDRTFRYISGNGVGTVKELKLWHGMGKNLVYADDESGDGEVTSYFSSTSKAGMGDYYVMDFLSGGQGGTTTDLLSMQFNSTMYWHER